MSRLSMSTSACARGLHRCHIRMETRVMTIRHPLVVATVLLPVCRLLASAVLTLIVCLSDLIDHCTATVSQILL